MSTTTHRQPWRLFNGLLFAMVLSFATTASAGEFRLQLRSLPVVDIAKQGSTPYTMRPVVWPAEKTAVIVCDVWDLHHCLNAVRRLEEFAPRLDALLQEARARGAVIIHAPSDCMAAYETHPSRRRAVDTPRAKQAPPEVAHWCMRIPTEERATFPIDQSDGGEDDDPVEHAEWVAKLKVFGRNPGTPWKSQSKLITIDGERDYISDRGDEVWNILKQRGVENVILTGVHTNMCVLGRPFGLRQMVRNGFHTVLVRDMTDCMYSPKRWPYVDHFTGNDLVIAHVERHVAPTITSDQILGGAEFVSPRDRRPTRGVREVATALKAESFANSWTLINIPFGSWKEATHGAIAQYEGTAWYRCAVRVPSDFADSPLLLSLPETPATRGIWMNGKPLTPGKRTEQGIVSFVLRDIPIERDDANLLVVQVEHKGSPIGWATAPVLSAVTKPDASLSLRGRWQIRLGDDATWNNIPLPARYGASPDIVFDWPAMRRSH